MKFTHIEAISWELWRAYISLSAFINSALHNFYIYYHLWKRRCF